MDQNRTLVAGNPSNLNCTAVICSLCSEPEIITCGSPEELAIILRGYYGQDVFAYIFRGDRLHITKGPNKYLVGPDGIKIPLAPDATGEEIDPNGSLYVKK